MDLVDQMIDFVPGLDADDPGLADARNRYWHLVSFVAKRDGAVAWLAASSWFGLFYGLVILIFALGAYTVARSRMRLEHNVERLDDQVVELQMTRKGLIEAEKMASLGRMVAGFAHEVNTPVGVAVGAVSHLREEVAGCQRLLQQDEVEAEELERHLSAVLAAAELCQGNLRRAAELVRSFKRTSVDQSSESRRRFDMCELVEDTRRALHNRFKNTAIRIEVECADGLQLNGRPGIYSQILTNLLVNSLVHGFGNGEQAGQIRIQLDQPAPDRLRIRFGDDGRGMSAATLGQLFEPFFTTSREQGGSGLGLYICYNLVQVELKGSIQCQSLPGQGTLFTIEHPL
jgi:signal transduction histidine kinase